jgi:integrase
MISISMFLRTQRGTKSSKKEHKIYAELYKKGVKLHISTDKSVEPEFWDKKKKRCKGKYAFVNVHLDAFEAKVREVEARYVLCKQDYTPHMIAKALKDENTQILKFEKPIVDILKEMNDNKFSKGIICKINHKGYKTLIKKIECFLKEKGLEKIGYSKFDYNLFDELVNYLKTTRFNRSKPYKADIPIKNCSVKRSIGLIHQGNKYALRKDYTKTLITEYETLKDDSEDTPFLTMQELRALENLDLSKDDYLDAIRDIFVFSCYTGFLFCDLKAFNPKEHLETDEKGNTWIIKPREKTGTKQVLPLLPKAKAILDKWEYFPFYCELSHNRTIKVLARQAGIKKHLTNRVGRKTAGMIWLNEGVSIEVVANMLGHKNIRITQKHYAHIQRERIERETVKLMQPTKDPQEALQSQNIAQGNILDLLAEAVAQKLKTA